MNAKTKWMIITLCMVTLVAAAVGMRLNVQAVASPPADQVGPYKVGFVTNTYYDSARSDHAGGPRPIQTFIWYPAAPDNNGNPMPPAVYPNISIVESVSYPDISSTDFEAYGLDPAYQAVAASKDGPFPLVVLSPGLSATPVFFMQIGARLASHGFVVAIPYNFDDRVKVTGEPAFYSTTDSAMVGGYVERARDVQYLLTRLVADSQQSGSPLSGAIRPDQIAVAGHSIGGGAALALAGGDDQACDMAFVDPGKVPPEACVSIQPDPRIKAIVVLDGMSQALRFAEMARIKIPSMGINREWETLESVTPPKGLGFYYPRQHAAIQGHPNYRVDVANANHSTFTIHCEYIQIMHDEGIYDDATVSGYSQMKCPVEPASQAELGNLINKYMVAFLKTALVGDAGYKDMLTPGYALKNESFIEFFETEQGSPSSHDEDGYFSYFKHQPGKDPSGAERAKALKDPVWADLVKQ